MNTCRFCNEPSPCSGDCGELNLIAKERQAEINREIRDEMKFNRDNGLCEMCGSKDPGRFGICSQCHDDMFGEQYGYDGPFDDDEEE